MNYTTIRYSNRDGVGVITFNRADQMNAMNTQMRAEIAHAVKAAEEDARALVLTGKGLAFCAGQDLGDRASPTDLNLERTLRDEYMPMLNAIYNCRIPTIAAVNGAAAGAGANLALAADVVIASESAYFMQAFSRIGLIPDAGGTYWMPRQMGFAKAMGAALFADKISARQAADWGMIWDWVADETFADHWWQRAKYLADGPSQAFRAAKKAIRSTYDNDLQSQLELEGKLQGKCGNTRDFVEGVTAFMEKRPAKFEGR